MGIHFHNLSLRLRFSISLSKKEWYTAFYIRNSLLTTEATISSASFYFLGPTIKHQLKYTNMPSTKRKPLDADLQRRVRARQESSEDVESVASELPAEKNDNPASDDEDISDSGESEEEVFTIRLPFRQSLTMISV
jgi:hypothetical protein